LHDFSQNVSYKRHLDDTGDEFYAKYADDVVRLLGAGERKFLDAGCGTGRAIEMVARRVDKSRLYGIDVSELFIRDKRDTYQLQPFDGQHIPFDDETFDVVGSFTVIEHVEEPERFLTEEIRVLKPGGYLITACPNFLSVFNHVRGYSLAQKFAKQLRLLSSKEFERNDPIIREEFASDDDAIVVTNMVPLIAFHKASGMKPVEVSGLMTSHGSALKRTLGSAPLLRLLMPSCYIIALKTPSSARPA
jgi:SAM-dependent methyltransferase